MAYPHYENLLAAVLASAIQLRLSSVVEVSTVKYLSTYAAANALVIIYLTVPTNCSIGNAIFRLICLNISFNAVLVIQTAIYRLFFHPLASFPGKRWAAATKLHDASLFWKGQKAVVERSLHQKYGDFVRTGPNEISINNVEAIEILLRRTRHINRGPFYEMVPAVDEHNLLSIRDNEIHRQWRKIWDSAFRSNAFAYYNPRVEAHVSVLVNILERAGGSEVNATKLISDLAFDIMTDLAFGIENGLQEGKGDPTWVRLLQKFTQLSATMSALRNVCELMPYIPEDTETKLFKQKYKDMLARRMRLGKRREDIFQYLLKEDEESGTQFTPRQMASNAQLVVIGGADTTSTAIVNLFREIALNIRIQDKLHKEVAEVSEEHGIINVQNTAKLPYLNAVIDETLRVWPPFPSGPQAMTGPEGATIAGTLIPPNTSVRIPFYTQMKDERYFPEAESFIPERWNGERPDLVRDKRAFTPFSYGPHRCVGKTLALSELRLTVARVVEKFEITLGPSYNENEFLESWKDYFAVKIGALPVQFRPRKATTCR